MGFAINGQLALSPDTTPLFAVFFVLLLAFIENFQPCGINHQMRDFIPYGRFKTDMNRLAFLLTRV